MKRPFVIAGPCSAETLPQMLSTAAALVPAGVDLFRAGIWKPRTRPGCFEGVGEPGLDWLVEVRKQTGLGVCCEVATPSHVEKCLGKGIDALWIGARTTVNPFMVQELAEALRGSAVKIMVKNPVNHDLGLWAGAIERLAGCGVTDLVAIHRGVSGDKVLKYRNNPAWELAIRFRSRFPEIPILCDPSHMGGDSAYVRELSQRALDLGFDGLMIESHYRPGEALCDSSQQLTPPELISLLSSLKVRETTADDEQFLEELEQLRARIDDIDANILSLLSRRMGASAEIGHLKKKNNVSIIQMRRWEEVLSQMLSLGGDAGLDEEFVRCVFNLIHEESINVQNRILEDSESTGPEL